jgi:ElaB/YqjD/DUF883 family membrane-anchored ribosome-binding protein
MQHLSWQSIFLENHLETTARDNIVSTTAITQDTVGPLYRASSSAHAAVDSIAGAADAAARKAKPAIDRVVAMAHHAVDTAASAAAPTADWLTGQRQSLRATQKKLVADSSSYISANPLKAVGIAVATGFVLSGVMLFFRRGKRAPAPPSA